MHSHQVGSLRNSHPTSLPLLSDSQRQDEMFTNICLVFPEMEVGLSSFLLAEVVGKQVDPAC